uniref:uncharacterized protein LOC120340482 n=1 Tax=Styela clava TaxID=7725 RepID=UPI00193A9D58|nr:uncharacterized protein LOC120340482 [Styela clava]
MDIENRSLISPEKPNINDSSNSQNSNNFATRTELQKVRSEYKKLSEKNVCRPFRRRTAVPDTSNIILKSALNPRHKRSTFECRLFSVGSRNFSTKSRTNRDELAQTKKESNKDDSRISTALSNFENRPENYENEESLKEKSNKSNVDDEEKAFEEAVKRLLIYSASKPAEIAKEKVTNQPSIVRKNAVKKAITFRSCYLDTNSEKDTKQSKRLTKCPNPIIRPGYKFNSDTTTLCKSSPRRKKVSLWRRVILKQHHLSCQVHLKSQYGVRAR